MDRSLPPDLLALVRDQGRIVTYTDSPLGGLSIILGEPTDPAEAPVGVDLDNLTAQLRRALGSGERLCVSTHTCD